MHDSVTRTNNRQIAVWLFSVCALIFLMIVVGGITRLTESGLSMVKWHPIHGVIPPLNESQWMEEFEAYKAYPEYQKVNRGMSLGEFKAIFFWEYGHRLLGRLIGLAFFVPFVFFLWRKKVEASLKPQLWLMFFLGGLQGLVGWWMVKSGLIDQPDVSHYRLTAHLGLAVFIFMYIFWVALGLVQPRAEKVDVSRSGRLAKFLVGLIFIQILLGGLVAGLNAGFIYNSWPLMEEALVPEGLFELSPWYINFFENLLTVQFDHRIGAYVIFALTTWLWWACRRQLGLTAHILMVTVIIQVLLGILTLIYVVPIPLAALHQAGAIVTLSASLYFLHRLKIQEGS
ncbi:COX15/CtaA family protein [Luteithermobacter gelatinilyticus]|uniref:COX15/CtaA family protein n=1 Tax=Luteithermobacter gelatinilyticus TaxID=2582913 RepID=UPI0011067BCD|nr:COX15/CtaA family protein [Luteithermobacter gelatinilyticus]